MEFRDTNLPSPMPDHIVSRPLGWEDVYIITTRDGSDTIFSRAFEATYHSIFGAVGESKHVFIQNGLETQLPPDQISILEFGFGTGLNAFLAYLFALRHEKPVLYIGIEAFPLEMKVAEKLDYPAYLSFPEERDIFLRMHDEQSFTHESFRFSKQVSFDEVDKSSLFNCIFFDAFAPGAQPELWEQTVFEALYQMTADKGCLVTYCAQGEVRRRLMAAGYHVERLAGPPGKREMLRGVKSIGHSA